jgi:hypothetical protein
MHMPQCSEVSGLPESYASLCTWVHQRDALKIQLLAEREDNGTLAAKVRRDSRSKQERV